MTITIGPSARAHHVAALDAMNGVIWIHGGYDGGASVNNAA